MRILVSGSSGLIGSALLPFLTAGGHRVIRLVRSQSEPSTSIQGEVWSWDPERGTMLSVGQEGLEAAVHLAGANIAGARWTEHQKEMIRDSRVKSTRLLCDLLVRRSPPPKVLVCASAIGYYADRGDEILREESAPGSGFLADVCREWEAATRPAVENGIRVVNLRIGIVLSPLGGALAKMLTPFKLGAGGMMGSGRQYMSWIAVDDVIGAIHFALTHESLRGPVNAVAPNPVSNRDFTRTLGRVLSRPTFVPLPAFAARLALGEMADALLLASTRVEPSRLLASGFTFRYPDLEGALRRVLGKANGN
jgi:uncharacterized protein (TIGR01777 family)